MSRITTHVLDTSSGIPAAGIEVKLYGQSGNSWNEIASGITNENGRIGDLISADAKLSSGTYKLSFETRKYFEKKAVVNFYPCVEIIFQIDGSSHYHIPLLISPYGYTTYRGS